MKIALFHNLPSGGAKRAVFEWTQRLAQRHTIDLFTMQSADHSFCDIGPFINDTYDWSFVPRRLFDSPLGRLNQLQRWRDLGDLDQIHCRMAQKLDAGGYDVIFAHTCQITFLPLLLAYVQTPSVYYLHEPFGRSLWAHVPRPYSDQRQGIRAKLNQIDPLIQMHDQRLAALRQRSLHRTSRLLANSRFTAQKMSEWYSASTDYSPYGVNSADFYPLDLASPPETPRQTVISVGEMSRRKGFDFLIESIGRLPAENRPILWLVNNWRDPQEYGYLVELANAHNVTLRLDQNMNSAQLREAYNEADLCVYTPVNEPLGLVALEAMACGRAVVGVAEGGVAETVVDGVTGRLTPRNAPQFAEALAGLLADSAERTRLGQNARNYVLDEWSWEQSTTMIERHLEAVAC